MAGKRIDIAGSQLSPTEMVIWQALAGGDKTLDELTEIVYAGTKGGPEGARGSVKSMVYYLRKKRPEQIENRTVYGRK